MNNADVSIMRCLQFVLEQSCKKNVEANEAEHDLKSGRAATIPPSHSNFIDRVLLLLLNFTHVSDSNRTHFTPASDFQNQLI